MRYFLKQICLSAFLALGALSAQAGDYEYLVFTNTSGVATILSVSGLTMHVNGTTLQVTNNSGTVDFTLTELAAMRFSNDPTALENVLAADQPVQVYSLTGVRLGSYGSLLQAAGNLGKGTYVITDGINSQTILLP